MTAQFQPAQAPPDPATDTVDVLIVGAGISGIGAAWHLRRHCPGLSFAMLEAQADIGGTWRTHRYPGARSDSDLFTFGYAFKPWRGAPIATAAQILAYLNEVLDENALRPQLRLGHRIVSAAWDSASQRWQVEAEHAVADGAPPQRRLFSAGFLWMCQGYYRHDQGYTPDWPGLADFQGRLLHPQTWPEGLDLGGQRVLVIGSGATAATLVPAIAGRCAQLTLLQRSPTYFITGRNANELADTLRQLEIPPEWTHEIVRRKILFDQAAFVARCRAEPEAVRRELLAGVTAALGGGPEAEALVARHFTPRYRPWQQRIAFVPEADLFKAIREGQASVVTGEIERFVPTGVQLKDGQVLAADVVVSATGFHLSTQGGIAFSVDGRPVDLAHSVGWHGTLFTGLPNLAWVFGYFRASWTLKADLVGGLVCRLLQHMQARGARSVQPQLRPQDQGMALRPWVDAEDFNPGYIARGQALLPRQGSHSPWLHTQDYAQERHSLPGADLDDGSLVYR